MGARSGADRCLSHRSAPGLKVGLVGSIHPQARALHIRLTVRPLASTLMAPLPSATTITFTGAQRSLALPPRPSIGIGGSSDVPGGLWDPAAVTELNPKRLWCLLATTVGRQSTATSALRLATAV